MKKILLAILFLAVTAIATSLLGLTSRVSGQSASDSAVSDEAVKENVKKRLEKVAGDQSEAESAPASSTGQKRAWFGIIEDLTNQTVTIKTTTGSKQAEIAAAATVIDADRQVIKAANLEVDSFVTAMGYLSDNNVLDTRRLVVSDPPEDLDIISLFATLKESTADSLEISSSDDTTYILDIVKSTTITQLVDNSQAEITSADLNSGDNLVIIASVDSKNKQSLEAIAIHLATSRPILSEPDEEPSPSPEE